VQLSGNESAIVRGQLIDMFGREVHNGHRAFTFLGYLMRTIKYLEQ